MERWGRVESFQTEPWHGAARRTGSHAKSAGGGYTKSLFPEKILLLYHSVDPTGSQTVSRVTPFLYNSTLETRLTFLCFWNAILQRASFAFI